MRYAEWLQGISPPFRRHILNPASLRYAGMAIPATISPPRSPRLLKGVIISKGCQTPVSRARVAAPLPFMSLSDPQQGNRFFLADSQGPRDEQQDAGICLQDAGQGTALLVVGDGVGGKSGGRIASQKVKAMAAQLWEERNGHLANPALPFSRRGTRGADRGSYLPRVDGAKRGGEGGRHGKPPGPEYAPPISRWR